MNSRLALVSFCLVLAAGCGGSHSSDASSSATAPAGGMATAASGGSMNSSSTNSGTMSGGSMSGGNGGTMSGKHHGSQMAMSGAGPAQFPSENAAADHCPSDTVVWLNLKTKVYHLKGSSTYGTTKHGAYVCEQEANTAGDRAAKGGG